MLRFKITLCILCDDEKMEDRRNVYVAYDINLLVEDLNGNRKQLNWKNFFSKKSDEFYDYESKT